MIINFKQKILNYIKDRIKEIDLNHRISNQILLDNAQLNRLFEYPVFFPVTAWSTSPSLILHFLNDIVINNRKNIIEFGSGVSTLYIAKLIKNRRLKSHFFSVESDKAWLENMENEMAKHELSDYVTFVYAPITKVQSNLSYKNQKEWYDSQRISEALNENNEIDSVLIDGPHGYSNPYARFSAVPFLKNKLKDNFAIFLDDTNRNDEVEINKKWCEILNVKPKSYYNYSCLRSEKSFDTQPFIT